MSFIRKLYDWLGKKVDSPFAIYWLAFFFFIEAIFFIPVDPLLILFCLNDRANSLWYATAATLSSVFGGVFAYLIGFVLWDWVGTYLVRLIISETIFNSIVEKYKFYQNWAVFIAGFTPIPYKAITLSAGFCRLYLPSFVFFSVLSRGLRFFLLAGAIRIWGKQIQLFIDRYFNQLVILFTILLFLSFFIFK